MKMGVPLLLVPSIMISIVLFLFGSTCPTKGSKWFVSCNEVLIFHFFIHSWFNFSPKNVSCVSMNKMLNMYMGNTWVHCSR
jgi:hypothetical protein